MSQELTGESAVVAAASKGIGPLIARKLGAERGSRDQLRFKQGGGGALR